MSQDDEDYPEWFRKRRTRDPFFGDIDRMFHEMEKMMEEEFKSFTEKVPKGIVVFHEVFLVTKRGDR